MTIKVISTNPHHTVVKQVVCRNCGSTLEYTPNDVTYGRYTDYSGSTDSYNTIKCPTCSEKVEVP